MSNSSSLLLLGVGTSGSHIARGVLRAFGSEMRLALADTDAATGQDDASFTLLGGNRLSGRGAGGDVVSARLATEDSISQLDPLFEGVRLVVITTCLGGGTGGGATLEILKRLRTLGIPSVVFATTPFHFEGEDRLRNARGILSLVEDTANVSFFLPLDKLVADEDNFENALRRATDTVATGVTLFWRLIEKPGYLRLDADRLRRLLSAAGRGRFATVSVQGADRATEAVEKLTQSPLLTAESSPVRSIICGVLGGEDLRLSELGRISEGLRATFGEHTTFDLGTVNDEATFCGRLAVVVLLFEKDTQLSTRTDSASTTSTTRRKRRDHASLGVGPVGRGRFNNAEPTIWQGEDLDLPTFVRQHISLDF